MQEIISHWVKRDSRFGNHESHFNESVIFCPYECALPVMLSLRLQVLCVHLSYKDS